MLISQKEVSSSRQRVSLHPAAAVVLVIAVVQLVLQLSLLTRGVEYLASSLVIDDTYYYLQAAWNTKDLGFVTFDGLHSTNGVQLLWFAIILLLALLAQTKIALLFTTMAVSFILNGLSFLVILKIGATLRRPGLALMMAALWALQSLPFRIYTMGMENSLHALVFWAVIWQAARFLVRVREGKQLNFWALTAVLILNAWTRLDSALLSAVVYAFCLVALASTYRGNYRLFLQKYVRVIGATGVVAVLALAVQLGAFWLMDRSLLPVSALVKTAGLSRGVSAEAWQMFVNVLLLGLPAIIQDRLPDLVLVALAALGVLLVIGGQVAWRGEHGRLEALRQLWYGLLIGEILYHSYVALSGVQYTIYFTWYRSPSFIFWVVTGALLAHFAFAYLSSNSRFSRAATWGPLGLSLLLFVVALYMFVRSLDFASPLYAARYDAALWIEENSAPDEIFAAWNTGQLGFFSDRTFINLDGVINSVDYYERVLDGPVPLADYLAENNVAYLVDYNLYAPLPQYPVVHSFRVNDEAGRSIRVWRVASPISTVR